MPMLKLPVLLLLFMISLHSAQIEAFTIAGNYDEALFDLAEDNNGDLSAVGFSQHFSTRTRASYDDAFSYLAAHADARGEQMHLLRFKRDGSVHFNRQIAMPERSEALRMRKRPDDGYLIAGQTLGESLLLCYVDALGSIEKTVRFGTAKTDTVYSLLSLRNGGAAVAGDSMSSRERRDSLFENGLGLNDAFVTRFSPRGEKLWNRKYGTNKDESAAGIIERHDGTLLLALLRRSLPAPSLQLLRLDESGDVLARETAPIKKFEAVIDMTEEQDGNLLLLLRTKTTKGSRAYTLARFNPQLQLLTQQQITDNAAITLTSVVQNAEKMTYIAGYTETMPLEYGVIFTYNRHFERTQYERFERSENSRFERLTLMRDGRLAVAGSTRRANAQQRDYFIAWITPKP